MDKEKIIEALSAEVSYQTAIRTKKGYPRHHASNSPPKDFYFMH
jgi:hypothetical protein